MAGSARDSANARVMISRNEEMRKHVCHFFIIFLLASTSWMFVLAFGAMNGSWARFLSTIGGLGMLSAAALIAGGFFGFLFGIPRSLATPGPMQVQPNTNLEQISDWLTKVLVGVGLTQIGKIYNSVQGISDALNQLVPDAKVSPVVCLATLVTYFFSGFLWGYFESRTSLMGVFNDWAQPHGEASPSQSGERPSPEVAAARPIEAHT